jgi:hypothetical protein
MILGCQLPESSRNIRPSSSKFKESNKDSQARQTDEDVKVWRSVGECYKRLASKWEDMWT